MILRRIALEHLDPGFEGPPLARMEGLIGLQAVSQFGTTDQQRVAKEALAEFVVTDDRIVVDLIHYFRENPLTADALREMGGMD